LVLALVPRELPTWGLVAGSAALDNPHRSEGAAVKAAANRGAVLIDGGASLPKVHASPIRAPLEHQLAIPVPLSADSGGSRPAFRDDLAHHSDLMSLGVPR